MDEKRIEGWIEGYLRAWESNDPAAIGALFTEDARYYTAPFRPPWSGRDTIVEQWIGRKDDPGTWEFEWDVLGSTGDPWFVRGVTRYRNGPTYSNLWVIRLAGDGRCSEFVEWFMEHT